MTSTDMHVDRCGLPTPFAKPANTMFSALMSSVRANDSKTAATHLRHLAGTQDLNLCQRNIEQTVIGLETDNWTLWAETYRRGDFFGSSGDFLLVAPFETTRSGTKLAHLSAIAGRRVQHEEIPLEVAHSAIIEMFGELRQPLTRVWPIAVTAAAGLLENEEGEAFIVPNGFTPIADGDGPALNNLTEQRRRFGIASQCIEKIFDDSSADLLLSALYNDDDYATAIADEYQMHDNGHATGISLISKLKDNVILTTYLGGFEEWRADWVGFALAEIMLPASRVERMLASNLVTRFGLDAHRQGGLLDTDVTAAQLTFNFLIDAGALDVAPSGQLKLTSSTLKSMIRDGSIDGLRAAAVDITRAELRDGDPRSIWHLFSSAPKRSVELLFREHVRDRCAGMFESLR